MLTEEEWIATDEGPPARKRRRRDDDGAAGVSQEVKPLTSDSSTTAIVSVWPARITIQTPTAVYTWRGPGDVVHVRSEDLPLVWAKNGDARTACCGGGPRVKLTLLS